MPRRALIERRPWLLASLVAGISYYFISDVGLPGLWTMLWKGAGVAFLAVYALVRAPGFDGRLLAAVMVLGAAGDMAIEIDLRAGAACFLVGHVLAMVLYFRNWRPRITISQRLLASLVVPLGVFIAVMLAPREQMILVAIYAFFVSGMAASAWTSRFPRYRTGIGAMMFLASDLLIFARMGLLAESDLPGLLIWPLYYFGQFLICVGVTSTLRGSEP